jgi:hypothetical protein
MLADRMPQEFTRVSVGVFLLDRSHVVMMRTHTAVRSLALLECFALLAILSSCENKPIPVASSDRMPRTPEVNATDAKRLSDGATKLLAAMKRPTRSFHFAYNGQENLASDKAKPPVVGSVTLQAEFSPEEIQVAEIRGKTITTSKARYGDDVNWGIANLKLLQVMTNPTLAIAVGASVTSPPSIDLVGTVTAEMFTFDTTSANTPSARRGLERARLVVTSIKDCKGTAWIAEDSGQLIKFNIDSNFVDGNNHSWKEHYEGIVSPK